MNTTGLGKAHAGLSCFPLWRRCLWGPCLCLVLATAGCDGGEPGDDSNSNGSSVCGAGWVLVPAGPFTMGIDEDDPRFTIQTFPYGASPKHTVQLSAYCIQKTEVTVAQYRACVEAGKCAPPGQAHDNNRVCNYTASPGSLDKHPVNCLTWDEARSYCQAGVNGDLPSEAQWEKAARGTADDRIFPWGDEVPDCSRANYDSDDVTDDNKVSCDHNVWTYTWEVGHISSGRGDSPYGLKDMAGNIAEWVLDCADSELYAQCADGSCVDPVHLKADDCLNRITRGAHGGVPDPSSLNSVARHSSFDFYPGVGMRCVKPSPSRWHSSLLRRHKRADADSALLSEARDPHASFGGGDDAVLGDRLGCHRW